MAQPRPSLTLVVDIDESLASEDVCLEINRCYSYVGSTLIRTHPTTGDKPENIMRFLVKMGMRKYWNSTDEGADQLWSEVMERWFYNELHKVSNNMKIYNRRQREIGNAELMFDWIEVELQNGELHALLHCDSVSGIEASASEWLTKVRAVANEGGLGEGAVKVFLPAPASLEAQQEAGLRAKAQREALEGEKRAALAAEEVAAQQAAAALAQDSFLEAPELTQESAPVETEVVDPFALDEPDFALQYDQWLIEYADGTTRAFDSTTNSFR